jgi:hypothetical protein
MSTTDEVFFRQHMLERKWEYSESVHQLFVDLKPSYDIARREVVHVI